MAIGDDAKRYNFGIVPESGENGRVRYGAREINRTRDYIAQIGDRTSATPGGMRTKTGIRSGTGNPTGGANGDIYFKIIG